MAERRKGAPEPPHLCRKLARVALASGDGRQRKLGLAMMYELDEMERRVTVAEAERQEAEARARRLEETGHGA